jgi:hypothetical protein
MIDNTIQILYVINLAKNTNNSNPLERMKHRMWEYIHLVSTMPSGYSRTPDICRFISKTLQRHQKVEK